MEHIKSTKAVQSKERSSCAEVIGGDFLEQAEFKLNLKEKTEEDRDNHPGITNMSKGP